MKWSIVETPARGVLAPSNLDDGIGAMAPCGDMLDLALDRLDLSWDSNIVLLNLLGDLN